jgi:hypothetical protein
MKMTVLEIIEDFWFDWELQELTQEEISDRLIDAGCDPKALVRRARLLVLEAKANHEMQRKLDQLI